MEVEGAVEVNAEGDADASTPAEVGASVAVLGLSLDTKVGTVLVLGAAELDGESEG